MWAPQIASRSLTLIPTKHQVTWGVAPSFRSWGSRNTVQYIKDIYFFRFFVLFFPASVGFLASVGCWRFGSVGFLVLLAFWLLLAVVFALLAIGFCCLFGSVGFLAFVGFLILLALLAIQDIQK